ncbi:hypothetical protein OG689_23120 [Kitasatospora sp. NBC_00240]|uniref:hypothetical protein n=1 Tax=Kitasatospora sp. NBC_00240 TaxID=2903567 RepID=UPI00224E67D8|nr:hypothetical protein [Kitasatospora sp. NBC_00240]MCX5212137.1 hypothetical protein [Kitasatospora sp. NBC_00240]
MPITDEIKKTLNDPTPLYALAGAGDLAYEKLREVPGKVEALAADRKATQERATARLQEAQARLVEAQAKVTESVNTLPTDLKVLQEKAQTFALQQVGRAVELAVKAKETYDELAVRGKGVVDKGRGEEAGELPRTAVPEQAEPVEAELVEDEDGEDDAPVTGDASGDDAADAEGPTEKKAPRARRSSTQK